MAKLADILINERVGGATFYHKFPCYVGSDGVFAIEPGEYAEELKAFVKDIEGVTGGGRITATSLKLLKQTLTLFAREMLDGESETRLFILFDPKASGRVSRSENGQIAPYEFGKPDFALSSERHTMRTGIELRPEIAVLKVKRTVAKTGSVSYTTTIAHDHELGTQGVILRRWTPMSIENGSWWRVQKHLIPYTETTAARLNLIMENLTRSACDLVDLQREDRQGVWKDE